MTRDRGRKVLKKGLRVHEENLAVLDIDKMLTTPPDKSIVQMLRRRGRERRDEGEIFLQVSDITKKCASVVEPDPEMICLSGVGSKSIVKIIICPSVSKLCTIN
jgi:hypothetical protein